MDNIDMVYSAVAEQSEGPTLCCRRRPSVGVALCTLAALDGIFTSSICRQKHNEVCVTSRPLVQV